MLGCRGGGKELLAEKTPRQEPAYQDHITRVTWEGCAQCWRVSAVTPACVGLWMVYGGLLLPAFYREADSDLLIPVSSPESHQITQAPPESSCYSPMHSGYQHLTLYYESSALQQQEQFKWSLFPRVHPLPKSTVSCLSNSFFVVTLYNRSVEGYAFKTKIF